MALENIFGAPPEYLSGLLGVDPDKLRKQALTTGLVNTALAFAAQPRNQNYGSVLPYAARALMAGQQGAQGVYQGALQDFQTKQKIEELKRQQEQQQAQKQALSQLPESTRNIFSAFGSAAVPNIVETMLPKPKPPEYMKLDDEIVEISGGKAKQIYGGEEGKPRIKLSGNQAIEAKTLFPNNPNPSTWDANQLDTWNKYQSLPSEAEHARLKQDAETTFYNTGQRIAVPPSKNQYLRSLGNSGVAPSQPVARNPNDIRQFVSTPAAQTSVQQQQQEQEVVQQPIISKVPPKQRETLLLEQPQARATLSSVGASIDLLDNSITNLLSKKAALKNITGFAGALPLLYGDRRDAAETLEEIKTQIAFNTLKEMREASKTGGAVGNVTEKEWPRLESAIKSLNRAQSYDQLVENLQNIQNIIRGTKSRASQKYFDVYGNETAEESVDNLSPAGQAAFQKYYQGQ